MLQRELRDFADRGFGACAIEASSIGIAERRLDGTRIAVAVFTNFTQDHLDYHGSMDAYWQAKAELFRWPGLRAAVVNIDDVHGAALVANLVERGDRRARRLDRLGRRRAGAAGGARHRLRRAGPAVHRGRAGRAAPSTLTTAADRPVQRRQPAGRAGRAARARPDAGAGGGGLRAARQRARPHGAREPCRASPLAVIDYAHTPDALDKALAGLRPLAQAARRRAVVRVRLRRRPRRRQAADDGRGGREAGRPRGRHQRQPAQRKARPPSSARSCWAWRSPEARPGRARPRAGDRARRWPRPRREDVVLLAGKGHEAWQEIARRTHRVFRPLACDRCADAKDARAQCP